MNRSCGVAKAFRQEEPVERVYDEVRQLYPRIINRADEMDAINDPGDRNAGTKG